MAKFLFIVPPFTGHINPTLSTGKCLLEKGHSVAWIGHDSIIKNKIPSGGTFIPIVADTTFNINKYLEKLKNIRGIKSIKYLFEDVLLPLAHSMHDHIQPGVDQYKPDIIICDQQTWAGFIVAIKNNIPYATSCTTSAAISSPFDEFTRVSEWSDNIIINLQKHYGIKGDRVRTISELLTLIYSTKSLVGDDIVFPKSYKFVGPAIEKRPHDEYFPWGKFKTSYSKKIFFSFGTLNSEWGKKIFQSIYNIYKNTEYQIICSAPKDFFPLIPKNFIVEPFVPQLEILPNIDLVFSHAGHNTVCETLAHGIPLVLCPVKDDQSIVAHQCVMAGVGERVKFGRLNERILKETIEKVLNDKKYKEKAKLIQKSLINAGGSNKAAEYLIQSVASTSN